MRKSPRNSWSPYSPYNERWSAGSDPVFSNKPSRVIDSSKWSGRPVLVTGAAGFIASHLVEALARAGANVRAFVRYNSRNDYGWLEQLDATLLENVEIFRGDLANPEAADGAVQGCDSVFRSEEHT